jgi:3-mercaptopyruvate sulfurtransferase SseA
VAWRAAGCPIATTAPRPEPVTDFGKSLPGHPEYLMVTEEVKTLIAERDAALVSVRSWAEYTGATSGYSYIQPRGRIAGDVWGHAGSAPLRMDHYRNVDNTMRNYHDIAAQWRAWGVTPDKRIAFYSGFTNLSSIPCLDLRCWVSYEDILLSPPRSEHRPSVPDCGCGA